MVIFSSLQSKNATGAYRIARIVNTTTPSPAGYYRSINAFQVESICIPGDELNNYLGEYEILESFNCLEECSGGFCPTTTTPPTLTGACCQEDGTCLDGVTEEDCGTSPYQQLGFAIWHEGLSCSEVECCRYRANSNFCFFDGYNDTYIPNPDSSQCNCVCGLDHGYTCEDLYYPPEFVRDPNEICACGPPLCTQEGEFFIENPNGSDPPCVCGLDYGYTCQDFNYPAGWGKGTDPNYACTCDCLVTDATCAEQNPNYVTGFKNGYFNCNCECSFAPPHNAPCPSGYMWSGNPETCDCIPSPSPSPTPSPTPTPTPTPTPKPGCRYFTVTLDPNQITFIDLFSVEAGQIVTITHSGSTTDNVNTPFPVYQLSPVWLQMSFSGSGIVSSFQNWVAPSNGVIRARHTSEDGDKLPSSFGNNAGLHIMQVEVCDPQ